MNEAAAWAWAVLLAWVGALVRQAVVCGPPVTRRDWLVRWALLLPAAVALAVLLAVKV